MFAKPWNRALALLGVAGQTDFIEDTAFTLDKGHAETLEIQSAAVGGTAGEMPIPAILRVPPHQRHLSVSVESALAVYGLQ
ncbi:MAG TPA: hypothetical protein VIC25_05820 [Caulobacteraceae bacterium]|jgi:hypothetical protein